jgi:hypothetical protein
MVGFRENLGRAPAIAGLPIPASVLCAVLCEPIIRILFPHGRWPRRCPPPRTARRLLGGYRVNGAMLMLNRAFSSLQSNWFRRSSHSRTSPSTRCSTWPSGSGVGIPPRRRS